MNMRITRSFVAIALLSMSTFFTLDVAAEEDATAPTLYERLGSNEGLSKIIKDTIALHHKNPDIARYFTDVDDDVLAAHVVAFFAAGTGGPANYQGRDMTTAHAGMNMSDADYDSGVKDVLNAVGANGIDADSKAEVAAILESLRPAILGTTGS